MRYSIHALGLLLLSGTFVQVHSTPFLIAIGIGALGSFLGSLLTDAFRFKRGSDGITPEGFNPIFTVDNKLSEPVLMTCNDPQFPPEGYELKGNQDYTFVKLKNITLGNFACAIFPPKSLTYGSKPVKFHVRSSDASIAQRKRRGLGEYKYVIRKYGLYSVGSRNKNKITMLSPWRPRVQIKRQAKKEKDASY